VNRVKLNLKAVVYKYKSEIIEFAASNLNLTNRGIRFFIKIIGNYQTTVWAQFLNPQCIFQSF